MGNSWLRIVIIYSEFSILIMNKVNVILICHIQKECQPRALTVQNHSNEHHIVLKENNSVQRFDTDMAERTSSSL